MTDLSSAQQQASNGAVIEPDLPISASIENEDGAKKKKHRKKKRHKHRHRRHGSRHRRQNV